MIADVTKFRGWPPAGSIRPALAVACFAGFSAAMPSPAAADLKLCNFTESRVGVTVGYKDDQGWLTEGWWNMLSRGCVTVISGELKGRFYYVHAIDYDRGGEWAGKTAMCIDDKTFTIRDIQDCAKRGHKETGFYEVDTGDAKDYTIRLVDPVKEGAGAQ